MSKEISSEGREELVSQLHDLMKKENSIRNKIDKIDFAQEEAKRKRIIGYCFRLKSSSSMKDGYSMYFYCTGYKERRPAGTIVTVFGRGKSPVTNVELNHYTFEDWIEDGKKITPSIFNKHLKKAASMILKQCAKLQNK